MRIRFFVAKVIEKIHIAALNNCSLGRNSKICSGSRAYNTSMGCFSYVGSNCTVINVSIGNYCSIADGCVIGGPQHRVDYVSTSPVFHKGKNSLKKNYSSHDAFELPKTIIGNDVWIGNGVLIKGGCRIGNGAVVGMGSIVTHDVPDYEVWAGNPAHLIKTRFSDQVKDFLLELKWWEWDQSKIERYARYFDDPIKLKRVIEGEKEE